MQVQIFTVPMLGNQEQIDVVNTFLRSHSIIDMEKKWQLAAGFLRLADCAAMTIGFPKKRLGIGSLQFFSLTSFIMK